MFGIKWVVHRRETQPVEIENSVLQDLDKVVESCQARFPEMTQALQHTPDGFLVFDSAGNEVRRWFESARPNLKGAGWRLMVRWRVDHPHSGAMSLS
jgi:hypothetical protein